MTFTFPLLWRRGVTACLVLAIGLGPLTAPAQVRLPALGETASADLSIGAERRLGEQIMREGRRDPVYLDDPVLLDYVQSLWRPLLDSARRLGNIDAETDHAFAWEIFLVRDRSVNAFALPGGYVGVHLGLIGLTSTTDQLASVLAHELTHVSQRHIARSIQPQQSASLVALAALLLGIIAASRANSIDMANAAILGGQAAAAQGQLNFSRDMEREADRVGFAVLTDAGFSPAGMAGMFEKLEAATRLNDNNGFPYLRSHPLTVDRISEARNRVLLDSAGPAPVPTLRHALMQARARVMMDESAQGLQRLVGGETSSPLAVDRLAALYAGALAASRLQDHARAEDLSAQALDLLHRLPAGATGPDGVIDDRQQAQYALGLLQAQVRLARGDTEAALRALDTLPAFSATRERQRPALLLRAQALLGQHRTALQAGQAGLSTPALRTTTEALQTWVAVHPQDATAWERLAETSEALGLGLRALRASAEARAVLGDLTGAIDRLRAAQAAARASSDPDFIEASVIDARLRQLAAQRRERALEARESTR